MSTMSIDTIQQRLEQKAERELRASLEKELSSVARSHITFHLETFHLEGDRKMMITIHSVELCRQIVNQLVRKKLPEAINDATSAFLAAVDQIKSLDTGEQQ